MSARSSEPRALSTADVARVLGVPEARIRGWVRAGWCKPERRGRGLSFAFQDLVVLRAAKSLGEAKVPAARVRRALRALARELGDARSLSGLRIAADGRRVVVRDDRQQWEPESGQLLLDFSVDALAREAARLAPSSAVRTPEPEKPATPRANDGDHAEAHRAFEQGLAAEEKDPAAAKRAYRRALARDPDFVDAYVNLARLVHESGRAKEAVALYHEALRRSPDDAEIHYNIALALEDVAGAKAAVAHYERAIALEPGFADAHWNLAGLCEATGRKAEALRHYREYEKLTR